ncbi:MAG: alpha/beta hydrolase [Cytophagaceae bacterium]|nr:MAG: alpha/beta hydrolase [Cytophagaceae bacterium]
MPTRHLLAIDNQYWHYRQQGDMTAETAIVLLHSVPGNSAMFAPLFANIASLRPKMRILAPDIPGYGGTDAPLRPIASLQDYLPSFRAFFREMGLRQVILYGTGTGAQLAIAYANAYPDKVASVLLDEAFLVPPGNKQPMLIDSFPDLTPHVDGSHLNNAWQMATNFGPYLPLFMTNDPDRISTPPTAEQTNQIAMDILNAGPAYANGYRAAVDHDRAEHIQRMTVPTTLFRWEGSAALAQIDELIAQGMPANVQVADTPSTPADHYKAVAERAVKGIKN